MERRYLVAALAIIATFTGFSHGFHSLQRMSFDHANNAAARCWANSAAQTVAKVRAHFRHDYSPEEAQLVAEMDLPGMQSDIAEQMARQDADLARCARERALEQAERTRRDVVRMQEQIARAYREPIAVHVNLPPDLEQQTVAAAARLASRQVQLQIAAEKLADMRIPSMDVSTDLSTAVVPNVHCKIKVSRQPTHDFQYGFTSK